MLAAVAKHLAASLKASLNRTGWMLAIGGLLCLGVGAVAPPSFMQHFIVFVLSVFVGFQVIWNVSHSLHTPLMAVTNAISGATAFGGMMLLNTSGAPLVLASVATAASAVNIAGGFLVTQRMLDLFKRVIDRRADLDTGEVILAGEPDTMSYEALQDTLGELIHGEETWATLVLPAPVANWAPSWRRSLSPSCPMRWTRAKSPSSGPS